MSMPAVDVLYCLVGLICSKVTVRTFTMLHKKSIFKITKLESFELSIHQRILNKK